jgi:hypothetical protein
MKIKMITLSTVCGHSKQVLFSKIYKNNASDVNMFVKHVYTPNQVWIQLQFKKNTEFSTFWGWPGTQ